MHVVNKNWKLLFCAAFLLHRYFCRFYYICKEPRCNEKPSPFFSCHTFFFCQFTFPIFAPFPHRFSRKSAVTKFGKTQLLHRRTCRRAHEYSNRSAFSRNPPSTWLEHPIGWRLSIHSRDFLSQPNFGNAENQHPRCQSPFATSDLQHLGASLSRNASHKWPRDRCPRFGTRRLLFAIVQSQ